MLTCHSVTKKALPGSDLQPVTGQFLEGHFVWKRINIIISDYVNIPSKKFKSHDNRESLIGFYWKHKREPWALKEVYFGYKIFLARLQMIMLGRMLKMFCPAPCFGGNLLWFYFEKKIFLAHSTTMGYWEKTKMYSYVFDPVEE